MQLASLPSSASASLASACDAFPILKKLIPRADGRFVGVLWVRPLKTRKEFNGATVTKEVRTVVRAGINHEMREAVKEARESGDLPSVNNGLPWGQWSAFPLLITHKGQTYVRLYPVAVNDVSRAPRVIYRENGVRITRERAQALCLASEFSETTEVTCYTLKAENLRRVK